WPERFPIEKLERIKRRVGSYFWNALFQQRPRPPEGSKFKIEWIRTVDNFPRLPGTRYVRFWDLAGTAAGGDYTVGALVARTPDGMYYLIDVARGQWSSGRRDAEIRSTAILDADTYGAEVVIWGEQEPGSSGIDAAAAFRKNLEGFNVHTEPASGSKELRADPLASAAEGRTFAFVRGAWNAAARREFADFPRGKHDDTVDATSGAYNKLARGRRPFNPNELERAA
ncbi:MAG TPA: phage terminase large subunit, partial [Gemmatimonadaceae bacterium]|nr:phage terminase large subunit [Gemmatimonadaceae bacterium]